MEKRAENLNEWKQHVRDDRARLQNYVRLCGALGDTSSEGGPTATKEQRLTDWEEHYSAAHPDDRLVYDFAQAYAGLATIAGGISDGRERRLEAQRLADHLSRTDPFEMREFLTTIQGFLFPVGAFFEMSPELAAREIIDTEIDASFLETTSDLVAAHRDRDVQRANEHRAFRYYLAAVERGDPLAKSLHHWSKNAPREVTRLYRGGPKTIRRRIAEQFRRLPLDRQREAESLQRAISLRETGRTRRFPRA